MRTTKAAEKRLKDAEVRLSNGESVPEIITAQRAKWGVAASRSRLYELQKTVRVATRAAKRKPRAEVPDAPFNDDGSRHRNGSGPLDLGVLVHALDGLPAGQFRVTRPDGCIVEIDVISPR